MWSYIKENSKQQHEALFPWFYTSMFFFAALRLRSRCFIHLRPFLRMHSNVSQKLSRHLWSSFTGFSGSFSRNSKIKPTTWPMKIILATACYYLFPDNAGLFHILLDLTFPWPHTSNSHIVYFQNLEKNVYKYTKLASWGTTSWELL